MIYKATLQPVKEIEYFNVVYEEIIFSIILQYLISPLIPAPLAFVFLPEIP